ncbi:Uncharacterised protein [Mycobacterium tuberculosis]|nr:Uncharacterised protein [Mycobacterium tuberculosis]CKL92772.1 Uncharacterised protein [Mycobacterium tuberculosis]CKM34253.1 Uncharacterised protein [Mycobacterium tuberculosis]CKM80220.1 Uncharacterised protein [Mycobacterium tuberculosis]CKN89445.1 Uncharacterised protein [Mycobacterium tuberculosis]
MVAGGCVVAGGAEAGVVGAGVMTSVVTAGCVFVVVGGGGNGCCSGGAGPPVAGACTGGAGSVVGPSDAGAGDGGGAAVVVTPGLCGVPGAVGWSPVDNPIATAAPTSNTATVVPVMITAGRRYHGIGGDLGSGSAWASWSKLSDGRAAV